MWWLASWSVPRKPRSGRPWSSLPTYLAERPDAVVGILTTKLPGTPGATDYIVEDWRSAGLRAESCFRAYVLTAHRSELTVIGHLSGLDWESVKTPVRMAFAI